MSINRLLFIILILGGTILTAAVVTASPQMSDEITVSAFENEDLLPDAAYNSKHQEYMVTWHTRWSIGTRDIRAARISKQGRVLATFTIYEHATKDSVQPSVAYDPVNDRYLVVWCFDASGNGSDWDLYGRFIPWNGPSASLTEFPICTWTTHQWTPKVTYAETPQEFLVVWNNEYQNGALPMYISGRRIKASDGSFPGGTGSDFTISHSSENRANPDVAYNKARNEYIVVYDNALDIFGTRFNPSASPLGGGEFGIAGWPDAEIHPAVASCKRVDQYLVAWQSDQGSGNDAIYARFVKGDGTPGTVVLIDDTTSPEREADVACNMSGTKYFIAWQTRYTNLRYGIWGRLVRPDESMKPQYCIVPPGLSADRTRPVVVGGATSYLTAWEHERDGTPYQDIHARLVQMETFSWPMFLPGITKTHKP